MNNLKPYEKAARKLCEIRGVDPDIKRHDRSLAARNFTPLGKELPVLGLEWELAAVEIKKYAECMCVLHLVPVDEEEHQ